MSNIVTCYFRVLEVISPLGCEFEYRSGIVRKQQITDCMSLVDRVYLSESIQLDLFKRVNVKLETPKRTNQRDYKPQLYTFRKSRKKNRNIIFTIR